MNLQKVRYLMFKHLNLAVWDYDFQTCKLIYKATTVGHWKNLTSEQFEELYSFFMRSPDNNF